MISQAVCATNKSGRKGAETPIAALTTTDEGIIDMANNRVARSAHNYNDLTGQRFGRLVATNDAGRSRSGKVLWRVRCDCGSGKIVVGGDLRSGRTTSCGCYSSEVVSQRNETHGMTKTPEYTAWVSMIVRCKYPSATGFERYGGRGITVCEEWARSFEAFYAYVGPRPSPRHSLDRYPNVNGNYEPGNVRWASTIEQARNKRSTVTVTVGSETRPLAEWCERQGLKYSIVKDRIHKLGWDPVRALGFPI